MGKYLILFKNSISESLVYRTSVFLTLVSQIISTGVIILLWSAIYSEGGKIGSYTLYGLIQYYILAGIISFTIQGIDVSWRVAEDIKMGKVTNYILKPISYFKTILSIVSGKSCFNIVISLIIILPLIIFSGYFSGLNPGSWKTACFILSFVIAFLLFVTFSYIVGLYTFWAGDVRGFNYVMKLAISFFSGAIIPLDLLPDGINVFNKYMPFESMTWIPVSILTGKMEANLRLLVPGIIWVVILFILAAFVYNKALKKYEGFGA